MVSDIFLTPSLSSPAMISVLDNLQLQYSPADFGYSNTFFFSYFRPFISFDLSSSSLFSHCFQFRGELKNVFLLGLFIIIVVVVVVNDFLLLSSFPPT